MPYFFFLPGRPIHPTTSERHRPSKGHPTTCLLLYIDRDFKDTPNLRFYFPAIMSIGVPVKLLHEAQGHIITIELKSGEIYRGKLSEAEDNFNCLVSGNLPYFCSALAEVSVNSLPTFGAFSFRHSIVNFSWHIFLCELFFYTVLPDGGRYRHRSRWKSVKNGTCLLERKQNSIFNPS